VKSKPFIVMTPIPRDVYEDEGWRYDMMYDIWEIKLQENRGHRLYGPIHIKTIGFGYIDDDSFDMIMSSWYGPWTFALVRAYGPALDPGD
jgi:hypothetical protein